MELDSGGDLDFSEHRHGDLIGSHTLRTDEAGETASTTPTVYYTAFGEPVAPDGSGGWAIGGEFPAAPLCAVEIRILLALSGAVRYDAETRVVSEQSKT